MTTRHERLYMPLDDEILPTAPSGEGSATAYDDAYDAEMYEGVPTEREEMPVGVYHFRLDSYELKEKNGQPYFNVTLKCQQEPHVGRVLFDTVPAVLRQDTVDAHNTSSPRNAEARKILKDRLWKQAQMLKAAGMKPTGKFSFQHNFLDHNPEFRVEVGRKQKRADSGEVDKDGEKIFKPTGEMQSVPKRYLPLV